MAPQHVPWRKPAAGGREGGRDLIGLFPGGLQAEGGGQGSPGSQGQAMVREKPAGAGGPERAGRREGNGDFGVRSWRGGEQMILREG